MKDKYQIVILYTGYNPYLNLIKAEEVKRNIEVVCVATGDPKWKVADGWPMTDIQSALLYQWDFLIYAGEKEAFMEISKLLCQANIVTFDKIIPIDVFGIPHFDFKDYVRLSENRISIVSNHCWGGFTYHYLHMQFTSPFINMFVKEEDYLKLLENFEYYMGLEVEYAGEERTSAINRVYPVGKLRDVKLHFEHYPTFEEAKQKWEERKKRLNMDNLFIQMATESKECAKRFDLLPYPNKIVFVPKPFGLESEISVEAFYDLKCAEYMIKTWAIAISLSAGELRYYDVIKLLNGDKNFIICS